jgi:hypothetical protein
VVLFDFVLFHIVLVGICVVRALRFAGNLVELSDVHLWRRPQAKRHTLASPNLLALKCSEGFSKWR